MQTESAPVSENVNFFRENFPPIGSIESHICQRNTGNCGLVSGIFAFSQSRYFESLCRRSMEKSDTGVWKIRFPFIESDDEEQDVVYISPEELSEVTEGRTSLDGPEGYRVLEAAYIKHIHGLVDRKASEGTWGWDFVRAVFGKGEHCEEVGKWLGDKEENVPWARGNVEPILRDFDSKEHLLLVGSAQKFPFWRTQLRFLFKGQPFLVTNHSYSISSIDWETETVYLVNPHNSSKKIQMTFTEMLKYFHTLSGVKINEEKILEKLEDK